MRLVSDFDPHHPSRAGATCPTNHRKIKRIKIHIPVFFFPPPPVWKITQMSQVYDHPMTARTKEVGAKWFAPCFSPGQRFGWPLLYFIWPNPQDHIKRSPSPSQRPGNFGSQCFSFFGDFTRPILDSFIEFGWSYTCDIFFAADVKKFGTLNFPRKKQPF